MHECDAVEGGAIRVSLTSDAPDRTGKTHGRTDTYRGRFVRLVPGEVGDGVPEGVSPADNEAGRRESLARLAALLKRDS